MCSDEQFVERLVRVGRDRYGHGGQLEPFDVLLVDAAANASDDTDGDATDATDRTDATTADATDAATNATDAGTAAAADAAHNDTDTAAAGADTTAAAAGQRQGKLLAVGPAAVVVLRQVVRAPSLPYRPHRYAVPDMRVLVDGANVDGRVDT